MVGTSVQYCPFSAASLQKKPARAGVVKASIPMSPVRVRSAQQVPASHGFTGISARIVMKGGDPFCVACKQRRSSGRRMTRNVHVRAWHD